MSLRKPLVEKDTFWGDFANAMTFSPVYRTPKEPEQSENTGMKYLARLDQPSGAVYIDPDTVVAVEQYIQYSAVFSKVVTDSTEYKVYGTADAVISKLRYADIINNPHKAKLIPPTN